MGLPDPRSPAPRRSTFFARSLGKGEAASINDARSGLLNSRVDGKSYGGGQEQYQAAILEQYKLCVEMAERVSARRAFANTFFLTLNTGVFTLFGTLWKDRPSGAVWWLAFPVIVLVGECLAWFWLLRSYRQLNSAKYAVIGALEELLPTSPYWRAEWRALGEGQDRAKYWPLTHLEQWVPLLFALTYAMAFVAILLAS